MKRVTLLLECMALVALSSTPLAAQDNLLESVRHESDVDRIYNTINNAEWTNANLSAVRNLWKDDVRKYAKVQIGRAHV